MKYYRFPDNKISKIAIGGLIALLLIFARDTMLSKSLIGVTESQFINLGLMALFGFAFLFFNRIFLKEVILDKRVAVIMFSAVLILLPMVIKRDWQMMYFSILLCVIFSVFLTYFSSRNEIAKYYVVIMVILAAYSLIANYGLKYLAEAELIKPSIFYNTEGGHQFYNFGLAYVIKLPYEYYRNNGLFREPGVYQYFSLLALYLNNYTAVWNKETVKWIGNAVLIIAMLSTISTVAIIALGLFVVALFFDSKLFQNKKLRYTVVLCAVIVFLCGMLYLPHNAVLYKQITDMITKLWTANESSSARYDSIALNLSLFFKHPIWGDTFSSVLHVVEHNTSSTLILYGALGVLGGSLSVISWFALLWDRRRKVWVNIVYILALFMSFNTQNLTWDLFFWLFPMMALTEKVVPWLEGRGTLMRNK